MSLAVIDTTLAPWRENSASTVEDRSSSGPVITTASPVAERIRVIAGNFFVDEEVLREAGVTDFDQYAVEPGSKLHADIFLD